MHGTWLVRALIGLAGLLVVTQTAALVIEESEPTHTPVTVTMAPPVSPTQVPTQRLTPEPIPTPPATTIPTPTTPTIPSLEPSPCLRLPLPVQTVCLDATICICTEVP